MTELKFPEWQAPLQDLILEFDPVKLEKIISKTEALRFDRLQQLDRGNGSRDEKIALQDALSIIRIIQHDRLGSPQPE
jgi:hypothetical protein